MRDECGSSLTVPVGSQLLGTSVVCSVWGCVVCVWGWGVLALSVFLSELLCRQSTYRSWRRSNRERVEPVARFLRGTFPLRLSTILCVCVCVCGCVCGCVGGWVRSVSLY